MSDVYIECLVGAKKSTAAKVLTIVLIVVTVIFGLVMFVFPPAMLVAVATGVGAYFASLYCNVEYEYLYLDKELSVDRILSQSKRKRMAVYSIDRMEVFAPINSWHLDNFKNRDVKPVDYSCGVAMQPDERYVMFYEGGVKVILSPSEELIKVLKSVAPRKVFND